MSYLKVPGRQVGMSVLRTSPWQSQLSLLSLDHGRGRIDRQAVAGRGKKLEYFTIAWNCLEGLVAVVAGALAGSISLVGFRNRQLHRGHIRGHLLRRMTVDSDEQTRERKVTVFGLNFNVVNSAA